VVGLLTLLAIRPWVPGWDTVPLGLLGTAVPTLAGRYVAARRRIMTDLRECAERTDREQRLLAERARAEERARLAREVHDVVTHRVTLMVLQAGALEVTGRGPGRPARRAGGAGVRDAGPRRAARTGPGAAVARSGPRRAVRCVARRRSAGRPARPAGARRLLDGRGRVRPAGPPGERDGVALLGEGRSNAEIAGTLYLTEATVKGHVSRPLEKSGCTNRTQLGLLAREARLRR
jgi:DNA-binding CsgD family transcriptional regulator